MKGCYWCKRRVGLFCDKVCDAVGKRIDLVTLLLERSGKPLKVESLKEPWVDQNGNERTYGCECDFFERGITKEKVTFT